MSTSSERTVGWAIWLLLGVVIAGLISFALYKQIGIFLFALFLYYATRPLYRRLDEYIDHPDLTATITILAIVLPLLAVIGYGLFQALVELDQFLSRHSLTQYRAYFEPYISLVREGRLERLSERLLSNPNQPLPGDIRQLAGRAFGGVTSALGLVFTLVGYLVLLFIFLFYFLRDDQQLAGWFFSNVEDQRVREFLGAVDDDLQTVFFGNLAIIAVTGAIAAVTYLALNVIAPGGGIVLIPVLLGLLIGIATLIPVVGMKIVYLPYFVYLVGLAVLGRAPLWHPVVYLLVTMVVIDFIPDFFIRSYLSSLSGIHIGLILLSYLLGTLVFGWYGLLLGPVVLVFAVHYAHQIFPHFADHVTFN